MTRKFRTAFFGVLSILIICFIFSNSMPGVAESSATSSAIADLLRPFLDPMRKLPDDVFHNFIRKLAHFVEFGALGVCLSGLFVQFEQRARRTWGLPLLVSVLVAMTDESIQFFTGRGNSIKDVALDSAGALCGVLFAALILWAWKKYIYKRGGR